MALFKSGNPALDKDTFSHFVRAKTDSKVMTIDGTVNKAAILLILTIAGAAISWNLFQHFQNIETVMITFIVGVVLGILLGFIIAYHKDLSGYLTPIYAVVQGFALGGISANLDKAFPGLLMLVLLLTFSVFTTLLLIYKARLIKVTQNLKLMIASATSAIVFYYLLSLGLNYFGYELPLIHEAGVGEIIFSVFVVIVAALNLVVDFDFIEEGASKGAPKYMEWYGAFGLLVTLIWLYLEILRLMAKSKRR